MSDGPTQDWFIYFVRCRDGEVYTGVATDVARRFAEHEAGGARAARFLRGRRPLTLLASAAVGSRSRALRLEARVKKLPRQRKLDIVSNPGRLGARLDQLLSNADCPPRSSGLTPDDE